MTEGIANVYEKLNELAGSASWPMPYREEGGSSHIGRFLKQTGVVPTIDQANLIEELLDCIYNEWISKAGPVMEHGIWDHFKGGVYLSLGVAKSADHGGYEVEYISLLHGTKHHRRCEQWNEIVEWPDGKYRSRFIYRGVDLESSNPPPFKAQLHNDTRALVARKLFSVLI